MSADTPRTITLPLDEWEDMIEQFRDIVDFLTTESIQRTAFYPDELTRWADEIGRQL